MDNKTCSHCKCSLPISEFNWKVKAKGILQGHCKICQRKFQNNYYASNPAYRQKVRADSLRRKKESKQKYLEYLRQHPCMDCGVTDPVVLTFDHRDPALKTDCVSRMVQMHFWKRVLEEIEKCDVVCFNCHARRTAVTQKWYKNW